MKKAVILIITFVLVVFGMVFYGKKTSAPTVQSGKEIVAPAENAEKNIVSDSNERIFFIAGWLPYWAKNEGAASLSGNFDLFSEINPFAFGVNSDGSLKDVAKIDSAPWPEIIENAKKENVKIVPTILWGDAEAMHKIFSDSELSDNHVNAIITMLKENDFPGVDIDYEGKDIKDRNGFSLFIESLAGKLKSQGKTLSCTVEARTQDSPPKDLKGTRAMSWANDLVVLNESCDEVRVMAYDEVFQIYRAQDFEISGEVPSAPNAGNEWVQEVIEYFLKYISPEKLVLGVPTYGWEFSLSKTSDGYHYTRFKSVSYGEAVEKANSADVAPSRTDGELSFLYEASGKQHLITFSDAESIRQKIDMAKSFGLKGISLFKIDGLTDPQLFSVL
jgi:spore germination protein